MSKEKRATWWKMFYHQRAVIDSISDEEVGRGLKAAFQYFDGEDIISDIPHKRGMIFFDTQQIVAFSGNNYSCGFFLTVQGICYD